MDEVKKPGRPRNEPVLEQVSTPVLTHSALGIYQGVDNQWYVAILKFDPTTGSAMVVENYLAGEDKYFANEAFKIKTTELDIV